MTYSRLRAGEPVMPDEFFDRVTSTSAAAVDRAHFLAGAVELKPLLNTL